MDHESGKKYLSLTSGDKLSVTVAEFDAARPRKTQRIMSMFGVHSLCHAPFSTLDFSPTGHVGVCNHFGISLAKVDEDFSVLELWNGEKMKMLREQMLNYTLNNEVCGHCVRQIEAHKLKHVFSIYQFDNQPATEGHPKYPKRIIFRLNNTCNLACIMCDGWTSSRIRREFENLPPVKPIYGKRFFSELEEMLPHLEHVEFYGGEPFLVQEHLRIFELIEKTGSKCTIYVNTNATVLNGRIRRFLERLNFKRIAVSMDAVTPEVHEKVRYGLKSKVFFDNLKYYMDLSRRRNINLVLNVTEHRKNWFEMSEIFRFAERLQLSINISTCIHPENITLYTLPSDQLEYVLDFTVQERKKLLSEFRKLRNLPAYNYYIDLLKAELSNRNAVWKPKPHLSTPLSDGLLATPIPGKKPFDTPKSVSQEIKRITHLDAVTTRRMLFELSAGIQKLPDSPEWAKTMRHIQSELGRVSKKNWNSRVRNTIRRFKKETERMVRREKKRIDSSLRPIFLRFWQPTHVMHFSHKLSVKLRIYRRRIKLAFERGRRTTLHD